MHTSKAAASRGIICVPYLGPGGRPDEGECAPCTPQSQATAESLFGPLDIKVVCSHQFLDGVLGDDSARESFVLDRVRQWVSDVKNLSRLAVPQPQAAFAAFTKSLQHEWTFLQ